MFLIGSIESKQNLKYSKRFKVQRKWFLAAEALDSKEKILNF